MDECEYCGSEDDVGECCRTTTLHFRVDGKWLTNFTRTMWLYEPDRRTYAKSILAELIDPKDLRRGLSPIAIERVFKGDARIEGMSDDGMVYIEEEDPEWKTKVASHQDFLKRTKKQQEDEEAAPQYDTSRGIFPAIFEKAVDKLGPELGLDVCQSVIDRGMGKKSKPDMSKSITPIGEVDFEAPFPMDVDWSGHKGEMLVIPRLNPEEDQSPKEYQVPKALYERYEYLTRTIRGGAFLGVSSEMRNNPLGFMRLEDERRTLHRRLCEAAGYKHRDDDDTDEFNPGEDMDFNVSLSTYLDKRTGWGQ